MSIQKKSLISALKTTKKANVASAPSANAPGTSLNSMKTMNAKDLKSFKTMNAKDIKSFKAINAKSAAS